MELCVQMGQKIVPHRELWLLSQSAHSTGSGAAWLEYWACPQDDGSTC